MSNTITALPAPLVTKDQVVYVNANRDAVVVQNLFTGDVYLHVDPTVDAYDRDDLIVILTHDEVIALAADHKTPARITKAQNAHLLGMHARGELPSWQDVQDVLAEMHMIDAETATLPGDNVFELDFFRDFDITDITDEDVI